MRRGRYAIYLFFLLLCGCAGAPYVTGDSRGLFDTANGMYGGNEFSARSIEGTITVANEAPAKAPSSAATAAAGNVGSVVKTPSVSAVAPTVSTASGDAPIAIDSNAFAAVFGPKSIPIQPSAEQLMQLDSLSLVAGDAMRIDLQKKILACRRAAEHCRIAPQ